MSEIHGCGPGSARDNLLQRPDLGLHLRVLGLASDRQEFKDHCHQIIIVRSSGTPGCEVPAMSCQ